MARDVEIERRLQNWARWQLGAGSGSALGYALSRPWLGSGCSSGDDGPRIPTNACEASETDALVRKLDATLRRTVEVNYLRPGGVVLRAAELGIKESALNQRICRAHAQLRGWLSDAHAQRERMRAQLEAHGRR